MHMILWHLARAGALLCLARSVNATSFRSENPHHVVRLEDIAWSSPTITQGHPEHVQLSFRLQDQPARQVTLDLERNDDIYEQPLQTRHLDQNGAVAAAETIPARSHLAFRGRATLARHDDRPRGSGLRRAAAAGWARLTVFVKDGVQLGEGAFSLDGVEYHVQPDYVYSRAHGANPLPLDHRVPTMIAWREEVDGEDGGGGNAELRRRSTSNETCSVADVDFNLGQMGLGGARGSSGSSHLAARQNSGGGGLNSLDLGGLVGSTAGCPGTRQIALLGIATDCSYTAQFNSTDDLRQHLLSVVNTASRLYEQSFNIALRLQNLTVSDANCPRTGSGSGSSTPWNLACSGSGSGSGSGSTGSVGISTRLSLFTDWRRGLGADGNAVWSLLTTCNSGSTVGIAWIGTVCNGARASGGSRQGTLGANVVVRTRSEWQVLAHEIGHNFGAVHDCTAASCNGGGGGTTERCCPFSQSSCDAGARYIMNPASTTTMTEFSPCTIGTICTAMGRNFVRTNCLSGNDNVTTISSGVCGNGIVEPGEECDCGGPEACGTNNNNACCNPTTCRLNPGAACDAASHACCTPQCQVAGRGSVCRASLGPCDPQEVCDGSSASCPADERAPDGQTCDIGGGGGGGDNGTTTTCASGQCTSRGMQCGAALLNSTGVATGLGGAPASACSGNSCQMNCFVGGSSLSACQITGADFLDGTPCGGGGDSGSRFCYSGECRASRSRGGAGGSSDAASWISRNKAVFIVIVVVAALLVLLVAWWCVSCVRRRSARRVEETNSARLAALRAHQQQQQQQQPPAMAARQPIVSGSPVVLPLPPSRRPVYPHRYA